MMVKKTEDALTWQTHTCTDTHTQTDRHRMMA